MDRVVAALKEQLSSLKQQNSELQRQLGRDPLCKGLKVLSEDFADSQEIEEALTVEFHGRILEISLLLPEDSLEPLFSGASWAGTCVWDASNQLCNYLERDIKNLEGKLVIELGCGIGMPGMCAHILGAEVILTEQEELIAGINMNIDSNFPDTKDKIHAQELNWAVEAAEALLTQLNGRPIDYIVCSDCIYEHLYGESWKLLALTMDVLCGPTTEMLISFERRPGSVPDGVDFFIASLAEMYNFTLEQVYSHKFDHAGNGKGAGLVQITSAVRPSKQLS